MKISIIYFSSTGKTKEMADVIADGMRSVQDTEVKAFPVDGIDYNFIAESSAVVFGTPTYYANTCWQLKKWFDESWQYNLNLEGKLGAVFVTADYAQGGADVAAQTIISHMLVKGMLAYSGGSALGQPYIHLGAIALKENFEKSKEMFRIFGKRIAEKSKIIA